MARFEHYKKVRPRRLGTRLFSCGLAGIIGITAAWSVPVVSYGAETQEIEFEITQEELTDALIQALAWG